MSKKKQLEKIIHGDFYNDDYLLIRETFEGYQLLIVHSDYFSYDNAIICTVGHELTDGSDDMLLDKAKEIVDMMNGKIETN
jgi:hypothetical protein